MTTTSKSCTQTTQQISWQSSTKRALDTNIAVCVCKVTHGDALTNINVEEWVRFGRLKHSPMASTSSLTHGVTLLGSTTSSIGALEIGQTLPTLSHILELDT